MSKSLYLKLNQISEVHEKDVYLKDVAELYSDDPAILAKCLALKVKKMGEQDFIIDYQKPRPPRLGWEWIKTAFVCVICFCGAAYANMTFNNYASVTEVFREI